MHPDQVSANCAHTAVASLHSPSLATEQAQLEVAWPGAIFHQLETIPMPQLGKGTVIALMQFTDAWPQSSSSQAGSCTHPTARELGEAVIDAGVASSSLVPVWAQENHHAADASPKTPGPHQTRAGRLGRCRSGAGADGSCPAPTWGTGKDL